MDILIIGADGFIGHNLQKYLKNYTDHKLILTSRHKKEGYLKLDILNKIDVAMTVKNKDLIINLAGLSGAVATLGNPVQTININTIGHLNILEACKKHNPNAHIIYMSSRLEYGKPVQLPVSSTQIPHPTTIYGISKYTANKYSLMYHKLYGLKTTVLRVSNPFGPQHIINNVSYNIINSFINLALKNKELTIFGKGNQKRDYLYIDDLCGAMVKSFQNEKAIGKVINLGGGQPHSLIDMARIIVKTVGKGTIVHKPWPHNWKEVETGDFYFDIEESKKILSWSPKYSVQEGIAKTFHLSPN